MKKFWMLRSNAWLNAARDGFISLLPLTFLRVLAILIQQLPWPAYQRWMSQLLGNQWHAYFDQINNGINYLFGVVLAVFVAIHLSSRLPNFKDEKNLHALTVGLASLIAYVLLQYGAPSASGSLSAYALLLAVFVGILATELIHLTANATQRHFKRLPYDTEMMFYYAMRASLPVIAAGFIAFIVAQLFAGALSYPVAFSANMLSIVQSTGYGVWLLSALAALVNQGFWFLGLHGSMVLDAYFSNIFIPNFGQTGVWRPFMDCFVLIGGSGATWGLLIAIMLTCKGGAQLKVTKISILPAIFNINDILLYGLPIVLNPRYWLPFIGVPLVLTTVTIAAAQLGLITFNNAHVAWVTPPLISGWLLTDSWRGVAFQLFEIALSTLLYLPFVRRAEIERKHQQAIIFDQAKTALMNENHVRKSVTRQQGQVGIVARGLLADLRSDIKNKSLHIAYQPQHDEHGKVVGVEALLRWRHKNYGSLSPIVAVTLAEDSGDIHQLGLWMLEEACACKARWNAQGLQHLVTAVNVSPEQLKHPDFSALLLDCIQRYNLEPAEIEIEITESMAIPDTLKVQQTLQQLSDSGVRIAMDDFGMGYSSLLYLRRIQVHVIKIDGSITRDVLINETNADIIRAITALGKTQKVEVIAEYVETVEQRDALIEMGVNVLQGYLYSTPLSEADCVEYFKHHSKK